MSKTTDLQNQTTLLQKLSAALFVVLAVAAALFMRAVSYPITIGYQAKDALASQTSTVLAPATHTFFDLQLRYIVPAILVLSALYGLLNVTKFKARYARDLKAGMSAMRWVYLGITFGLMVEVAGMLSGISDLFVLKLMGGLTVIMAEVSLIAERENKGAKKPVKVTYALSLLAGILPWVLLLASALGTLVYGIERYSWQVYALLFGLVITLVLLWVNEWKQFVGKGPWKEYLFAERNYIVIDMVAKAAFALILIAGFHR